MSECHTEGHGLAFCGMPVMIKQPTTTAQGCGARRAKVKHTNTSTSAFSSNYQEEQVKVPMSRFNVLPSRTLGTFLWRDLFWHPFSQVNIYFSFKMTWLNKTNLWKLPIYPVKNNPKITWSQKWHNIDLKYKSRTKKKTQIKALLIYS